LGGYFAEPGNLDGHPQGGGRLVAPLAPRTQPRSVGLDQDRLLGEPRRRGARPDRGAEADRQRERDEEAALRKAGRHDRVTREAVQDARWGRTDTSPHVTRGRIPAEKRRRDRVVSIAVVDQDGLADLARQVELSGERLTLDV